MSNQIIFLLLGLHVLFACIYAGFIYFRKSALRKIQIPIIFLVPIFGILGSLIIELLHKNNKQGSRDIGVEGFTFSEGDTYWNALEKVSDEGVVIPLEEAIIMSDFDTRRKLMLNTLFDDPMKYMDVIMVARHNDDIETSHYATTTISNAQRRYQNKIQYFSVEYENNPDDMELLDKYIQVLGKYIDSGLLEDYLLHRQKIIYSGLLTKKINQDENDKDIWIRKLRNSLDLAEYVSASEASDKLKQKWPEDEDVWYEALRVCVEGQDRKKLSETIEEIKHLDLRWTQKGKEKISIWTRA